MNKILIFFVLFLFTIVACDKDSSSPASESGMNNNTGSAGSMSKFTFNGNYLYVVQGQFLQVYNVVNAASPVLKNTIDLKNNAVETIFSNGTNLFFGTQNGMLIYGLSNPQSPDYLSTYTHLVSCDPVVVSGNLAYVTLSTGTRCNRGNNQLEVIDISDVRNPVLLRTYTSFDNPKGMAISGNYLYLCDAMEGFKVLDITDPMDIQEKSTLPSVIAFDVIAKNNILTITGKDGVYQYDCTDPLNLKFISKINVQ